MTLSYDGKMLTTPRERVELLKYWIQERNNIRLLKKSGEAKPWSRDPIFQHTYFCNVRREDDRVTKWIRNFYSPYVNDPMFEVNIVFSRLINWPDTLKYVGYIGIDDDFSAVRNMLSDISAEGEKVFGDAYIVSTNGLSLPKAQYVCEVLLPAAYERLGPRTNWRRDWGSGPLSRAYEGLIGVRGLGSFMAGQIIADLKNTPGHPLQHAPDFMTWATPGPGSLRGISWIQNGHNQADSWFKRDFMKFLIEIRNELENQGCELIKTLHNQDLQNCLCEFDKYCRIQTGVGRSKRGYSGV